jgi:hypothetical protein
MKECNSTGHKCPSIQTLCGQIIEDVYNHIDKPCSPTDIMEALAPKTMVRVFTCRLSETTPFRP